MRIACAVTALVALVGCGSSSGARADLSPGSGASAEYGIVTDGCIEGSGVLRTRTGRYVHYEYDLSCDGATADLTIRIGAHEFVLEGLTYNDCTLDPNYGYTEGADLNEYYAEGYGTWDGAAANIVLSVRDGGADGDMTAFRITTPEGELILRASGAPLDGENTAGDCPSCDDDDDDCDSEDDDCDEGDHDGDCDEEDCDEGDHDGDYDDDDCDEGDHDDYDDDDCDEGDHDDCDDDDDQGDDECGAEDDDDDEHDED